MVSKEKKLCVFVEFGSNIEQRKLKNYLHLIKRASSRE